MQHATKTGDLGGSSKEQKGAEETEQQRDEEDIGEILVIGFELGMGECLMKVARTRDKIRETKQQKQLK